MTSTILTYFVQGLKVAGNWQLSNDLKSSALLYTGFETGRQLTLVTVSNDLKSSDLLCTGFETGRQLTASNNLKSSALLFETGRQLTASTDLRSSALLCTGFETGRQLTASNDLKSSELLPTGFESDRQLTASNDLKCSALLYTGFKTGRQLLLEAPSVCSRHKVLRKLELCRLSELEVWQSLAPAPKCYTHTPYQYPLMVIIREKRTNYEILQSMNTFTKHYKDDTCYYMKQRVKEKKKEKKKKSYSTDKTFT